MFSAQPQTATGVNAECGFVGGWWLLTKLTLVPTLIIPLCGVATPIIPAHSVPTCIIIITHNPPPPPTSLYAHHIYLLFLHLSYVHLQDPRLSYPHACACHTFICQALKYIHCTASPETSWLHHRSVRNMVHHAPSEGSPPQPKASYFPKTIAASACQEWEEAYAVCLTSQCALAWAMALARWKNNFLGCTIRVLPGSAMRALSTFSPLFVSQGPYPPFSPICLTLGQFVNSGSAVKFRGTRGGTSAAKNVKNFTAEAP